MSLGDSALSLGTLCLFLLVLLLPILLAVLLEISLVLGVLVSPCLRHTRVVAFCRLHHLLPGIFHLLFEALVTLPCVFSIVVPETISKRPKKCNDGDGNYDGKYSSA